MANPTGLQGKSKIRVLVVDHHPIVLHVVTGFLQRHDDLDVVGAVWRGEEVLAKVEYLKPQVILLDLAIPELSDCLKVITLLHATLPEARIIVLPLFDAEPYRGIMLRAGAVDCIAKAALTTDLLPAIRRAVHSVKTGETIS